MIMADEASGLPPDYEELKKKLAMLDDESKALRRDRGIGDFISRHEGKFPGLKNPKARGVAESFFDTLEEEGVQDSDERIELLIEQVRNEIEDQATQLDELRELIASMRGNEPAVGDLPPDVAAAAGGDAGGAPPPPDMGAAPPPPPDMLDPNEPPPAGGIAADMLGAGMVPSDESIKQRAEEGKLKDDGGPGEIPGDLDDKAEEDAKKGSAKADEKKDKGTAAKVAEQALSGGGAAGIGGALGTAAGALIGGPIGGAVGGAAGSAIGGELDKAMGGVSDSRVKKFAVDMGIIDDSMDLEELAEYLQELEAIDTGTYKIEGVPPTLGIADKLLLAKWRELGRPMNDDASFQENTIDPSDFDVSNYSEKDAAALDALVDRYEAKGEEAIAHVTDPSDREWFDKWAEYKRERAAKAAEAAAAAAAAAPPPEMSGSSGINPDDIDENEIVTSALSRKY
jgi:hypothetical protein